MDQLRAPSPLRGLRSILFLALLATACLQPGASRGAAWDIDHLMRLLAANKSGRTAFIETKYIAMLNRPLVSTGVLVFSAPNRLEKWTIKPEAESMRVDGDTVTVERKQKRLVLRLQDYPVIAGFVESMRGTLVGDVNTLNHWYVLKLEGSSQLWTLDLLPKEPKMAAAVRGIRVTGTDGYIASVVVVQADGDRSVMVVNRLTSP
ncbi:MAG TPA: outer membrane lipoprotein carrier protein LolA [Pseudolabrys sp.]|nr:outer membrane lipoprotein carrier protein LolA [Pseudolabrys sp.]